MKKNKGKYQLPQSGSVNPEIGNYYKNFKKKLPSPETFAEKILAGDRAYLSRAITLLESKKPEHRQQGEKIVEMLLPHSGKSFRIGVTGVPGAGKSTLIDKLGKLYIENGHQVAVLAIDPTGLDNRGSVLGDKTRMQQLISEHSAFIRPSPSGNTPGGVSRKTRETMILCEAAGFDRILVETVGVGQSEVQVKHMTDFFLLLKIPAAGDELQGIKRGIMEAADAVVINKADGNLLEQAQVAATIFANALQLSSGQQAAPVFTVSSLENRGIDRLYHLMETKFEIWKKSGELQQKRNRQLKYWLNEILNDLFKNAIREDSQTLQTFELMLKKLETRQIMPYQAAEQIWKVFLNGKS